MIEMRVWRDVLKPRPSPAKVPTSRLVCLEGYEDTKKLP
jgi:hypothetical protein